MGLSIGWTDNPAWCFYDLLTNTRYGLGLPASAVDPWKWDLYTIAQYCDAVVASGANMVFKGIDDGNGGVEPRFTCNVCLNNRQEAYAAINTMAVSAPIKMLGHCFIVPSYFFFSSSSPTTRCTADFK